jgi:uncharacterized protein YjbI with pentapeptide repeats
MAIPQHLAKLNEGVQAWNEWRERTGVRPELSGADLGEAELSGANLNKAMLSDADLSGANLIRADLSGANLNGADLSETDLRGADLSGAKLCGAKLLGTNLSDANLTACLVYGISVWNVQLIRLERTTKRSDPIELGDHASRRSPNPGGQSSSRTVHLPTFEQ